ncbi:hypothetical protein [Solirubrobacter soli]|uniref:hypothetical protein n=1 Tax=Solirubrobacter soli TaxID=363832 RepID=UPI000481F33F|nr:hypothetical protein [Solirubrobacter soli]
MTYRVTQEFQSGDEPLTQEAADRLLARLRATAPEAEAELELGLGRFMVSLTFEACDEETAISLARTTAATALGGRAVGVEIRPVERRTPEIPHAACSDPS